MPGPSGSHGKPKAQAQDTRTHLEQASHTAEQFVSLYYSASDSPSRTSLVPTLYLQNSTIVWNGNPIQGQEGVRELIDRMPFTRYEVSAVDCQPVGVGGGAEDSSSAPSLMLTVSGTVTHHTSTSYTAQPVSNAPSGGASGKRKSAAAGGALDPALPLDSLPRAFSQTFVLVDRKREVNEGGIVVTFEEGKDTGAQQQQQQMQSARYFVFADNFRFVG